MNTVVRKHVAASSLPEEFRRGIDPSERVTVTVEVEESSSKAALEDLRRRLAAARPERRSGNLPEANAQRRRSRLAELGIDPAKVKPVSIDGIRSVATPRGTTVDEAVDRIRALRDEWDN